MGGGRVDGDEGSRWGKFFQVEGTRRWGSKGENIGHKGRNKIFLLWPSKGLFFFAKKLVSSKDEND